MPPAKRRKHAAADALIVGADEIEVEIEVAEPPDPTKPLPEDYIEPPPPLDDLPPSPFPERPDGVYGLTMLGNNPKIAQPASSVAWAEYRAQRSANGGYVGPDLFGGDFHQYAAGCAYHYLWATGTGFVVYATHTDPKVRRHWLKSDRYTCASLLELLAVVFETAMLGDPNITDAQRVCADLVNDLELPDAFWHGLATKAPDGKSGRLSAKGRDVLGRRLKSPKRSPGEHGGV